MTSRELQTLMTGSSAVVEVEQQRAIAQEQAIVAVAKRFPRNVEAARARILERCTSTRVADDGLYEYNRGGEAVIGPSIRLVELMAQELGNIRSGVKELSRRDGISECRAFAVDLERMIYDEKDFQVRHWRDTRKGGYAVTDERDIYEVIANFGARRKRACLLAVMDQEIADEAVLQCQETLKGKADPTPERVAEMLVKFEPYKVTKEMIEARIQRNLEAITPSLFLRLMRIHNSLRDGMSSVADWFEPEVEQPKTVVSAPAAGLRAAAEAAAKAQAEQAIQPSTVEPPVMDEPVPPPSQKTVAPKKLDEAQEISWAEWKEALGEEKTAEAVKKYARTAPKWMLDHPDFAKMVDEIAATKK